jgi:hypothetical protein
MPAPKTPIPPPPLLCDCHRIPWRTCWDRGERMRNIVTWACVLSPVLLIAGLVAAMLALFGVPRPHMRPAPDPCSETR